jgi:hypothetical protein
MDSPGEIREKPTARWHDLGLFWRTWTNLPLGIELIEVGACGQPGPLQLSDLQKGHRAQLVPRGESRLEFIGTGTWRPAKLFTIRRSMWTLCKAGFRRAARRHCGRRKHGTPRSQPRKLGRAPLRYSGPTSTIPILSLTASTRFCCMPRYFSVVWMEAWPSSIWICSRSPPDFRHNFPQVRRRS